MEKDLWKVGQVILKAETFGSIAQGLTGDIIIEKSDCDLGRFMAHASVKQLKVSKKMRDKIVNALVKLTGLVWQDDGGDPVIFSAFFDEENLLSANDMPGTQLELPLKIKQSPLYAACEEYRQINAQAQGIKAKLSEQAKVVLEEMKNSDRLTLKVENVQFIRRVEHTEEKLVVKGV
jgi:hypothetical protein